MKDYFQFCMLVAFSVGLSLEKLCKAFLFGKYIIYFQSRILLLTLTKIYHTIKMSISEFCYSGFLTVLTLCS